MLLGVTILLSLTSFSQIDTSKVCIPYDIAKQIAVDLVSGDSAKAELTLVNQKVILLQKKLSAKDLIIQEMNSKNTLCNSQSILLQQKIDIYTDVTSNLSMQNQKLKRTVTILGVTVGVTSLTALVLILVK